MKTIRYEIKNMFLRNIFCLLILGMAVPAFAQDDDTFLGDEEETETMKRPVRKVQVEKYELKTVKGVVYDMATKAPLPGIQVNALGNNRYASMSEEDGTFEIKVPEFSKVLYVHAPDFLSQQVAIGKGDKPVVVYMLKDNFRAMYDDNTHYTAARTITTTRDNEVVIDNEIGESLAGDLRSIQRSAAPGIGNAFFIRGINSLNANAMPLILVDGVELDMQLARNSLHNGQFNNLLSNIMPADIEKVTVLKNATALYGARGANGVILIETKRGHSMATRIDANISVGLNLVPRLPTMMNADQYRNYASELVGTINGWSSTTPEFNFMNDDASRSAFRNYHDANGNLYNYDWTDETYRTALTQNYNINVQGGDNVGMYNLSVGYMDAKSTAKENDFSRMNVRFNTDIYILPTLSTKFNISIARTNNSVFDDGIQQDMTKSTITSPTFLSLIKAPMTTPYQFQPLLNDFTSLLSPADKLYYDAKDESELIKGASLANPVAILKQAEGINKNSAENTVFQAMVEPTLQLGEHFSVTEQFSYLLNRNAQRYTRPNDGVPSFDIENLGTVKSRFSTLFTNENNVLSNTHVDFKTLVGSHSVKAFAGFRYNYFSFDADQMTTDYTTETNDKNPHISANTEDGYFYVDGANDVWKQMQWYANVDYNYENRYFLTLSMLAEANSRFGNNADGLKAFGVAWALFPSIQAGWVVTNEEWFPKNMGINYLRLNAGYDLSGNDDISNYAVRTSYNLVRYSQYLSGFQLTNIGNDKIKWETTRKLNLGFEANMLNNRIGVAFDYYRHKTSDLLTLKSFASPIAGINQYWSNGGELKNEGFEATVSVKPVVSKDWQVELGTTIGHYKNEVTKLADGTFTSSVYGTDNIITQVGSPVALFYGYKTNGVFANDATASTAYNNSDYLYMLSQTGDRNAFKAGDVHFVDISGDGIISEADRVVIGDPNPDIYGHIFANITWKKLTLSANFTYSLGNDVFNYQRMLLNSGSNFWNQQVASVNRWRYEDQVTDIPRAVYAIRWATTVSATAGLRMALTCD